ncbi:MAG: hypothetical protein U0103_24485 [Candidatus Obscuribacterales bacterium]
MNGGKHISQWLEAAAKHLIEESIVGCRDVIAHFTAENAEVTILVERTPVCRRSRGPVSVVGDGIWVHTDDSHTAAFGDPLKFEQVSTYAHRGSLVEALFQFLQRELDGQTVIDLHMEGSDGNRNTCFETTVYSDDGVSFTTGATVTAVC